MCHDHQIKDKENFILLFLSSKQPLLKTIQINFQSITSVSNLITFKFNTR